MARGVTPMSRYGTRSEEPHTRQRSWTLAAPSSERSVAMGAIDMAVWDAVAKIAGEVNEIENLKVELVPIENHFFGRTVTVSGLLTGRDLLLQRSRLERGDLVLLPRNMLDSAGERTLDDYRPEDLERAFGRRVIFAELPHHLLGFLSDKYRRG